MITVENLSKSYGDAKILDNINVEIKDGEFVSIIGPSGCGKSTLINIISGLDSKTEGKVIVEGKEITKPSIERIMVFQNAALFPWLTVSENVAFGLKTITKDKDKINKKVDEILRKVHLYKYKEKYPHELSGGMKQRVSIARSIIMDPKILLMDEPFSALDEQTRMLLHSELQQIWMETKKDNSFVTHNIREAVKLSDRVLIMGTRPGTIIADIKIEDSHPRELNSPGLIYKEKIVYEKLKKEIEKVAKEELGDEYELEKTNISSVHNNTMGGVYRLNIWPDFMFPSPITVAQTIIDGVVKGTYVSAFANSLRRLLIGYAIAVVVGTAIGALMVTNKTINDTLGFLIIAFQSVPSVVWLPLVLLWFNTGESAIIFVVVLGGVWNMIMSSHTGLQNVDRDLIKCGENLGYKGLRLFTKIMIPASIPHIITGMRLAWAFCWRALMAAEILGTGTGLGQTLMWGKEMGNMSTVLAVMFIIGTTGLITDNLMFKKIETKVYKKWGLLS